MIKATTWHFVPFYIEQETNDAVGLPAIPPRNRRQTERAATLLRPCYQTRNSLEHERYSGRVLGKINPSFGFDSLDCENFWPRIISNRVPKLKIYVGTLIGNQSPCMQKKRGSGFRWMASLLSDRKVDRVEKVEVWWD